MKHIMKCAECSSYTLNGTCKCGGNTVKAGPAKFSPQDNYASYRRTAKADKLKEAGLL